MGAELEAEAQQQDEMAQEYEASIEELKGELKARGSLVAPNPSPSPSPNPNPNVLKARGSLVEQQAA